MVLRFYTQIFMTFLFTYITLKILENIPILNLDTQDNKKELYIRFWLFKLRRPICIFGQKAYNYIISKPK